MYWGEGIWGVLEGAAWGPPGPANCIHSPSEPSRRLCSMQLHYCPAGGCGEAPPFLTLCESWVSGARSCPWADKDQAQQPECAKPPSPLDHMLHLLWGHGTGHAGNSSCWEPSRSPTLSPQQCPLFASSGVGFCMAQWPLVAANSSAVPILQKKMKFCTEY